MIRKEDILTKGIEFLDGSTPNQAMTKLLNWAEANRDQLSPEASAHIEQIYEFIFSQARRNAEQMQDGPQRRQIIRSAKIGLGEHSRIEDALKALESSPSEMDAISEAWSEHVISISQNVLDLLSDAHSAGKAHPEQMVSLSLLYNCVDELTSAIHLTRHNYFVQSNAHLRGIVEALDRVELFMTKPEWVKVWSGSDQKKAKRLLKVVEVRKLIGKKEDPIYAFLCDIGTHATFAQFQSRTVKSMEGENQVAQIFVHGSPLPGVRLTNCQMSLLVAIMLVNAVTKHFSGRLNAEEAEEILRASLGRWKQFQEEQFYPWAEKNDFDLTAIKSLTDKIIVSFSDTTS